MSSTVPSSCSSSRSIVPPPRFDTTIYSIAVLGGFVNMGSFEGQAGLHRGASGEEAGLCGMPRPPLGRATATTAASGGNRESLLGQRPARRKRERSGCWEPQPGRWHAAGVTERFSSAAAHGQAILRTTSQALRASSPCRGASGETVKLCGMPRPPLGRGGGIAKQ